MTDVVAALHPALPECQAIVRLHPKDYGGRWESRRVRLAALGSVVRHTAPVRRMDYGGFVTPLATHYSRLVATDGVTVARSISECVDAVRAHLKEPCLHRDGRARRLQMFDERR